MQILVLALTLMAIGLLAYRLTYLASKKVWTTCVDSVDPLYGFVELTGEGADRIMAAMYEYRRQDIAGLYRYQGKLWVGTAWGILPAEDYLRGKERVTGYEERNFYLREQCLPKAFANRLFIGPDLFEDRATRKKAGLRTVSRTCRKLWGALIPG